MAITFVAAGTAASGRTTVTPTLPVGWAADDIHIFVTTWENPPTFPTGWTILINDSSRGFAVLWRRAVADDTNPSLTGIANFKLAQIAGFRGCATTDIPIDASAEQANTSSTTDTAPAITPPTANDMILYVGGFVDGTQTATLFNAAYSGTNPTFTEGLNSHAVDNTDLGDYGICLAYGIKTDTTTTGTRTNTIDFATLNAGALISLSTVPTLGPDASSINTPFKARRGKAFGPPRRTMEPQKFPVTIPPITAIQQGTTVQYRPGNHPHRLRRMLPQRYPDVVAVAVPTTVKSRRTLTALGTGVGSRKLQGD